MRATLLNFGSKRIIFQRNFFTKEEVLKWKNQRFTGMNVTWHCRNCTGIMDKDRNFEKENKLFVSIANVIHEIETQYQKFGIL